MSIALRFDEPIETVAAWPWKKRYAYAIALSEHQRAQREAQQQAHQSAGSAGVPSQATGVPPQPSGTRGGVHPSVAKHEHVVRVTDD